ncbi:CaiB/BaiF CoA-transferase family protein [Marinoscillum sp. MHG1-6]|uniref:CaiB/BaiF CoA transferase family protein n=1 Tax=Marinoscillum sp. MHG1-6 TaxID=2959627 RepID=UPI0021575866|nr:CaiB/BaiF CoA-transferase family protein [Marinoscillum sp. MHG1-6]
MELLKDILVIDFSQFLSGPSASLRLADLGARVIKVEKPGQGDICRQLYVSNVEIDGESTIFHAINRNKESYTADLKNPDDLSTIKKLIAQADVVMHNFRPGVMERLGLSYEVVRDLKPSIIYAEISGYGTEGSFKDLPGQDLLLQAISGLPYLNNNADRPPTPMGVAVVDILAGTHCAQGILAALYKKTKTGEGSLVQVSMLESALDFQFEVLSCFLNDGQLLPQRSKVNHAHAYVAAPYGVYRTEDGYLALAMGDILFLGELLDCPDLAVFSERKDWFDRRDEIKLVLAKHLSTNTTEHWLLKLEPADIWCAEVLNYAELLQQEGYKGLGMEIIVKTSSGKEVKTTRCPIKVNGRALKSSIGAPGLGFDTEAINKEFQI